MVGSVRNMSTTATNVSYEIGDGTGYIDARVWLDSADDDSGKTTGVEYAHFFSLSLASWCLLYRRQDHYVGLMGTIKVFGGKRHVSATHIRPITDANEVQHHLLKALYVSLILRGGAPGSVRDFFLVLLFSLVVALDNIQGRPRKLLAPAMITMPERLLARLTNRPGRILSLCSVES